MLEIQNKFDKATLVIVTVYLCIAFGFGILDQYLVVTGKFSNLILLGEAIFLMLVMFAWYVQGKARPGSLIFRPIQFFKTRDKVVRQASSIILLLVFVIGIFATVYGYNLGFDLFASGVEEQILVIKPVNEPMNQFQLKYRRIVESGNTPYLYIDTTKPGVVVPTRYIVDGEIVLNISARAIHDFRWLGDTIEFTATFSKQNEMIRLPLNSIISMYASELQDSATGLES